MQLAFPDRCGHLAKYQTVRDFARATRYNGPPEFISMFACLLMSAPLRRLLLRLQLSREDVNALAEEGANEAKSTGVAPCALSALCDLAKRRGV